MTLLRKLMVRVKGPRLLHAIAEVTPRVGSEATSGSVVAIEMVEDPFYLGLFGALAARLRQLHNVAFEMIVVRSLSPGAARSTWHQVRALVHSNPLTDIVWVKAFARFCGKIAYRSASWLGASREAALNAAAKRLLGGCQSVDELEALQVDGVKIGDLVIDSYLRFRPAVRVELTDPYLATVLRQSLRDLEKATNYFSTRAPALYLTTYTTYIQHGVPARVALKHGVPVAAFGNLQDIFKLITEADTTHTKAFASYKRDFDASLDTDKRRLQGAESLEARLRGEVDRATVYMAKSAYGSEKALEHDVEGAVVLFLHDFYDSAHIYGWMIFHDFWDWATFTIDTLIEAGVKFVVKPHPNQIAAGEKDLADLQAKYPNVVFLPTAVSNRELVDAGMAGAITVYGTVASEMAYLGLPSLCCGNHPHISFEFAQTARTRAEYKRLLATFKDEPLDKKRARDQASEFYYMHNLALDVEAADARIAMTKYWIACLAAETDDEKVPAAVHALKEFVSLPGFDLTVENLAKIGRFA